MATAKKHYFVINQHGQSADRRGPFESEQAAKDWAGKHYNYPCWIVPAEYIGLMEHRPLTAEGKPVEKG